MQYSVPQFVDVEDKVIGPLTVKQFLYILSAAMVIFLLWALLGFRISAPLIILSIPILAIFAALAFLKINGRPFHFFLFSLVGYYMGQGARLWIWRRTVTWQKLKVKKGADEQQKTSEEDKLKQRIFPKTNIQKISEVLDSGVSTRAMTDLDTLKVAQRMRYREKELER